MYSPQCVITGCEFFSPVEGRWAHGDLHKIGSAYVFNAVTDDHGNTRWEYGIPDAGRHVIACHHNAYFERRGVVVFDEATAEMNDSATSYVRPEYKPNGRAVTARY